MNSATVTVKCFGTLRRTMAPVRSVTIPENETIRSVVENFPIDHNVAYLFSVNGRQAEPDAPLHDGDVLMIIPPISGG